MQVILLEKIANLGNLGEVVKVKDGFARNYLIPSKRARRATETAIKEFETRRSDLEKAAADKLTAAQTVGEKLAGQTVTVSRRPASTAVCSARSPTPTSPEGSRRSASTFRSRRCAAQRPAEDRGRSSGVGGAAHRRGGRRQGARGGRESS